MNFLLWGRNEIDLRILFFFLSLSRSINARVHLDFMAARAILLSRDSAREFNNKSLIDHDVYDVVIHIQYDIEGIFTVRFWCEDLISIYYYEFVLHLYSNFEM